MNAIAGAGVDANVLALRGEKRSRTLDVVDYQLRDGLVGGNEFVIEVDKCL